MPPPFLLLLLLLLPQPTTPPPFPLPLLILLLLLKRSTLSFCLYFDQLNSGTFHQNSNSIQQMSICCVYCEQDTITQKSGFKFGQKCNALEMYVQQLTAWSLKPDHLYSFYGSHDQLEQVTKLLGAMFLLLNSGNNCRTVLC